VAGKRLVSAEKTVHFFKITADGGDNGLFGDKLLEIAKQIKPESRETDYKGDHVNFDIESRSSSDGLVYGSFFQSREDTPSKRKEGEVTRSPIPLDDDENINETTHFVYSPQSSYIAVEWNFHGPKIGLITWVVNHLYKSIDKDVSRNGWMYIRSGNAYGEVMKHENIRSVTASLKDPSELEGLSLNAQMPEVRNQMMNISDAKLELSLRSRRPGGIVMQLQGLKSRFLPNQQSIGLYDKLKVEVEDRTGKAVEFDLVKDKLVKKVVVSKDPVTNEVDANAMFSALEEILLYAVKNYIT
jgi:hypothetical protein